VRAVLLKFMAVVLSSSGGAALSPLLPMCYLEAKRTKGRGLPPREQRNGNDGNKRMNFSFRLNGGAIPAHCAR
jgi:hypothetical protein